MIGPDSAARVGKQVSEGFQAPKINTLPPKVQSRSKSKTKENKPVNNKQSQIKRSEKPRNAVQVKIDIMASPKEVQTR